MLDLKAPDADTFCAEQRTPFEVNIGDTVATRNNVSPDNYPFKVKNSKINVLASIDPQM